MHDLRLVRLTASGYSWPDSINALSLSRPRSQFPPYQRVNVGPRSFAGPRRNKSVATSTLVPPSTGEKLSVASNGAFFEVPLIAARRGGSKTVTTASLWDRNQPIVATAWRVEPTPWGGSDVHHSFTFAGNHFCVFSTLVRAAKTSSIGRAMVIELLVLEVTSHSNFATWPRHDDAIVSRGCLPGSMEWRAHARLSIADVSSVPIDCSGLRLRPSCGSWSLFSYYDSGSGEPAEGYQAAAITAGGILILGLVLGVARARRDLRRNR